MFYAEIHMLNFIHDIYEQNQIHSKLYFIVVTTYGYIVSLFNSVTYIYFFSLGTRVTQSVQQLAVGWTIRVQGFNS
jgi:hypothetical protein